MAQHIDSRRNIDRQDGGPATWLQTREDAGSAREGGPMALSKDGGDEASQVLGGVTMGDGSVKMSV